MQDKYLPIGTVALLKGGRKRVMITGFCAIAEENKGKVFDYSGCIYPEGFITSNQVCLFNHDQIDKIFHTGLIDDEEKEFKSKLNELVKSMGVVNNELPKEEAPAEPAPAKPAPTGNEFFDSAAE